MFAWLRAGIRYLDVLPREKIFLCILFESRLQAFWDYAKVAYPPLFALFAFGIYFFHSNWHFLAPLVIAILFLIMSLLMCLIMMGKKALLELNGGQRKLYERLCRNNDHCPKSNPIRLDLAWEMNTALRQGRRDFLKEI